MADKKTDEEKQSGFYNMGKGASYTDRTSGLNSLADAMNLQMQNYSEQMALAAAQRRAARQDKKAEKRDEKKYGENPDQPMDTPTGEQQGKIDANTEANKKRTEDLTNPPPPPSAVTMKSPIKNLYSAARGSTYSGDIKKTSQELSGIVAFSNKVKLDMKKALNDKISAELKNFVPEAIDIQGFDNFKNGKNACTNFGMNLKKIPLQYRGLGLKTLALSALLIYWAILVVASFLQLN